VKRGGVLIIEPWLTTETFDPDKADGVEFLDEPDLKVARFSTTTLDTLVVNTRQVPVTRLRFDYMVKHADEPVMTFSEEHVLSMSSEDDFRRAFRGTDMEVTFDPDGLSSNGRGVYIARKVA
ncbi:MAG TPA: hypothetical protein VLF88_02535, partial [Candidatus Babeliales bacterium]|nr:hypothetical protein [Candidatus Babeliales bacterium]